MAQSLRSSRCINQLLLAQLVPWSDSRLLLMQPWNPANRIPFMQAALRMFEEFRHEVSQYPLTPHSAAIYSQKGHKLRSYFLSNSTDPLSGGSLVSVRKRSAFSAFFSTCWMVTGSSSLGSKDLTNALRSNVPMARQTPMLLS
jgi:hypothetical protein